jgi:hypothetical protein
MEEKVIVFKMPVKKSKKGELRTLDKIWKEKVKQRDNFTCQVCNKKLLGKNCHSHHIIPKGIKTFRWDINNGITLCFQHHKVGIYSPHMNALWFTVWLRLNKPKQFKYLIERIKNIQDETK